MLNRSNWFLTVHSLTFLTLAFLTSQSGWAQRIRLPDVPAQNVVSSPWTAPQQSTLPPFQAPPLAGANPTMVAPPQMQLPPLVSPPGVTIPQVPFDAYADSVPQLTAPTFPQGTNPSGALIYPPPNSYPWVNPNPPAAVSPPPGYPSFGGAPNVYGPPGDATWPSNSGAWPNNSGAWPNQAWSQVRDEWWPRLIEHPRFRHTYLYGESGDELQIHDTELATTLSFPSFLATNQPIRVSPGFIFHFWDGPDTAVTGVDLPAQAYSAFLAFDFMTSLSQPMGGELNFTIGMYTDFDHVTSDSLRMTGVGLGWFRMNNTTTFKIGIEYLDRLDIKLFPAVGFFLMPNPNMKVDLYFPRPKIAWRLPNNYNFEVWGYIGGEYGGGSWTIERLGGFGDQVDINDIRIFAGAEWMGRRRVTGFAEIGYVFERELTYRSLLAPIDIADTFMIRAGLAF